MDKSLIWLFFHTRPQTAGRIDYAHLLNENG